MNIWFYPIVRHFRKRCIVQDAGLSVCVADLHVMSVLGKTVSGSSQPRGFRKELDNSRKPVCIDAALKTTFSSRF